MTGKAKQRGGSREGAGRPAEIAGGTGGKRVNVYLGPLDCEIAARLGDGNVSEGIRKALQQAVPATDRGR